MVTWIKQHDSSMRDHYIICGLGRIGSRIATDLAAMDIPFVIIENNPDKILELDK